MTENRSMASTLHYTLEELLGPLNEVEKKIEMLVRDKEGKLELKELTNLVKEGNGQ